MKRTNLALASLCLALIFGCSSNDPVAPPAPKADCKLNCGPHFDDFFDEEKVANIYLTFADSVKAPDSCAKIACTANADCPDEADVCSSLGDGKPLASGQTGGVCCSNPEDSDSCPVVCHPTDPPWLNYLWSTWSHCPGGPFAPAELRYESPDGKGNVTMQNVGVRLRGSKTRGTNALQGLKLDFDIAPDERDANGGKRRFADLNRVNLLSIEGAGVKSRESSLLIQCLAYKVMRENGMPAPHCNHLNVYVNGKFYGVMQNAEVVKDARYLSHGFGDNNGTLYEASSGCQPYLDSQATLDYDTPDARPSWVDEDTDVAEDRFVYPYSPVNAPNPQKASYEVVQYQSGDIGQGGGSGDAPPATQPEDMSSAEWSVVSHPDKAAHAEAELIPMLKCGDVDTTPDETEFKACMRDWIDVDEWLGTIAGESLMPTVESFMVMRNYYLYFKPDAKDDPPSPHGGRFMLYSWDYDTAFHRSACYPSNCDPFTGTAGWFGPFPGKRAALAIRLENAFKTEYCAALNKFLAEAYKPELVDHMASVLKPSIELVAGGYLQPPFKGGGPVVTPDAWQEEVDKIRAFIVSHGVAAQAQVDALCN